MVELRLLKWIEPPPLGRCHYSTCVHQTLSVLKQTGGALASEIFDRLCVRGPFTKINEQAFIKLLRSLGHHELLEQMPTGEIILAPAGERIVESYDFYAAFASSVEYVVEHDGIKIGTLPRIAIPLEKEHILLGGRRWQVASMCHASRRVDVRPARGKKKPIFMGSRGEIHGKILQTMQQILRSDVGYSYVDTAGQEHLKMAREVFRTAQLDRTNAIQTNGGVTWFPWKGSADCLAWVLLARACGLNVDWDGICLTFPGQTLATFTDFVAQMVQPATVEKIHGAINEGDVYLDRFDEFVPMELLVECYMQERLAIDPSLGVPSFR